jgi:hypothetical protein
VRMAAIAYWGGLMIDDRGFWTRPVGRVVGELAHGSESIPPWLASGSGRDRARWPSSGWLMQDDLGYRATRRWVCLKPLVHAGDMVTPWQRPMEVAAACPGGRCRTDMGEGIPAQKDVCGKACVGAMDRRRGLACWARRGWDPCSGVRAHVVPAPIDCGERASMRGGGRQVGLQRVHGGGRSLADSWAQGRFNKPYFL